MTEILHTRWERKLPNTDHEHINTLVTPYGVYYAGNGFIFFQDYSGGSIKSANILNGTGYREVRLAASPDGSSVFARTDNCVFSLEPESLKTRWKQKLPDERNSLVSLLYTDSGLYAAPAGHVFRLDSQTGRCEASNYLPGLGFDEVRLAITDEKTGLVVGTRGSVLCLHPESLRTRWEKKLFDSGVTSVAGGLQVVFAGCRGVAHKFRESDGKLIAENRLKGAGVEEVRLALDDEKPLLYVGTNGWAFGLDSDDMRTVYNTNLPGSGFNVTSALDGLRVAYYANNGYVFELDDLGNVLARSNLPNLGIGDTRLAMYNEQESNSLVVGLRGYATALDLGKSAEPFDYGGKTYSRGWMPHISDISKWQHYNPAAIDGVGLLLGRERESGRIVGEDLKKKTAYYIPSDGSKTYTWVLNPSGGIIYKVRDQSDDSKFSPQPRGGPLVCAGDMRINGDSVSIISRGRTDGNSYGDCLDYVVKSLGSLGIHSGVVAGVVVLTQGNA